MSNSWMRFWILLSQFLEVFLPISDPGQETETKMVWARFKVFWFSKDNSTGHSERKQKKNKTEEEVGRQYQRMDRTRLYQLNKGS